MKFKDLVYFKNIIHHVLNPETDYYLKNLLGSFTSRSKIIQNERRSFDFNSPYARTALRQMFILVDAVKLRNSLDNDSKMLLKCYSFVKKE